MPTVSQLEYAIAVDSFRHFGRAAKASFVTQPTLSAQLAKLEEEIGVVLFDRSAHPIVPTMEGIEILAQARIVVAEFKKIQLIASGASKGVTGELIIGVIPTVTSYLVPLFLEKLSRSYAKLKIDVRELTTAQIVDALAHETIDVGILAIPVEGVSFSTTPLYTEPFYIYASKNHPIARQKRIISSDLDGTDLWLLEEGHCLRGQVLQACNLKTRKSALTNVRFESGSIETLKQLVRQGLGYTLIPHLAIDEDTSDDDVNVIPFANPIPAREIGLMYRRTQLKKPAIDALAMSVKDSLPQSLLEAGKKAKILPVLRE